MANQVAQGLLSPALRRARVSAVLPYLKGRVLDFGCGSGFVSQFVAPDAYLGVDRDSPSLAQAKEIYRGHTFLSAIPASSEFDTILLLAVIEHLKNAELLIADILSHLAPDGRLVLTTPNPKLEWLHNLGADVGLFSHEAAEEHENLLDQRELQKLANKLGMDCVCFEKFLLGANQLAVFRRK